MNQHNDHTISKSAFLVPIVLGLLFISLSAICLVIVLVPYILLNLRGNFKHSLGVGIPGKDAAPDLIEVEKNIFLLKEVPERQVGQTAGRH